MYTLHDMDHLVSLICFFTFPFYKEDCFKEIIVLVNKQLQGIKVNFQHRLTQKTKRSFIPLVWGFGLAITVGTSTTSITKKQDIVN